MLLYLLSVWQELQPTGQCTFQTLLMYIDKSQLHYLLAISYVTMTSLEPQQLLCKLKLSDDLH